jgi:hypothetical protein
LHPLPLFYQFSPICRRLFSVCLHGVLPEPFTSLMGMYLSLNHIEVITS